jgi:hypothetical protein
MHGQFELIPRRPRANAVRSVHRRTESEVTIAWRLRPAPALFVRREEAKQADPYEAGKTASGVRRRIDARVIRPTSIRWQATLGERRLAILISDCPRAPFAAGCGGAPSHCDMLAIPPRSHTSHGVHAVEAEPLRPTC